MAFLLEVKIPPVGGGALGQPDGLPKILGFALPSHYITPPTTEETKLHMPETRVPRAATLATMPTAMREARMAYSMDVTPDIRCPKHFRRVRLEILVFVGSRRRQAM
jgi:hypothetical protein